MNAQSPGAPGAPGAAGPPCPPGPAGTAFGPPLMMRLRRIHWVVLDYLTAAVCAVITFGMLSRGTGVHGLTVTGWHAADWLPPLLAVCLCIPVAVRRRGPVLSLTAILAVSAVVLLLGGGVTRGPFVPLAIVLYLVAATRSRRAALAALAASLALLAVQALIMHLSGVGAGNATGIGLILVICWMIGCSVRQRRAYAAHLRQQATDNAVISERLRIARELHDVVAHSMTVVAVQAGFGEYVFDRKPDEARAALGAIQTVTSEALADMQRMLGALRRAGAGQAGTGQAGTGQAGSPATAAAPPAPRPAWPTWTGSWPARRVPASGWRCCGPGRPGPSRPASTCRRSASSRRR